MLRKIVYKLREELDNINKNHILIGNQDRLRIPFFFPRQTKIFLHNFHATKGVVTQFSTVLYCFTWNMSTPWKVLELDNILISEVYIQLSHFKISNVKLFFVYECRWKSLQLFLLMSSDIAPYKLSLLKTFLKIFYFCGR